MDKPYSDEAARALVPLLGVLSEHQTREVTLPDGSTAYEHTFTPPTANDLPVLDWRPIQYAMYDISDWIDEMAPKIAELFRDLAPTLHSIQRARQRAAKQRARLSTQVKRRRQQQRRA